jgi:hypothetical protein
MGPEAKPAVPALERAARSDAPGDKTPMFRALAATLPDSPYGRQVKQQTQQMMRLREIGLAMMNYESAHKRFPPAATVDDEGKPLLSWRVALLPYLEQAALYDSFKHDEPWDSEHNLKMLEVALPIYGVAGKENNGKTRLMVFVGEGAPFEGEKGLAFEEIAKADGLSNTIMVVEAGPDKAVPWTKPQDLTFDPDNPLAALGNVPDEGFVVVFFDGSTHIIHKGIDAETLRRLIQHRDGQVIDHGPNGFSAPDTTKAPSVAIPQPPDPVAPVEDVDPP